MACILWAQAIAVNHRWVSWDCTPYRARSFAAKVARMADLYLKSLESERRSLWASARLKGLPKDSPERMRIAVIDADIAAHKAKAAKASK
jgi:hypothetical protein